MNNKVFAVLNGALASFLFFLVAFVVAPLMNWQKIALEYAILATVVLIVATVYSFSSQGKEKNKQNQGLY